MRPPRHTTALVSLFATAMAAACAPPPGTTARDAAGLGDGGNGDAVTTDANVGTPDLVVDTDRAIVDLAVERRTFEANACELDPVEDCVGGPGTRTLLRFSVETPNVGTGDLVLGSPQDGNPNFQYSPCHEHYHFLGYAEYQLLDERGDEAARGQKQAFCLVDTEKYLTDDATVSDAVKYSCVYQGIQRGWSDVYHARLPCQWIDITDVTPGDYTLRVRINSARSLPELDYANNVEDIAVTIGDPDLSQPTEPCPVGIPRRASAGDHRECGWVLAGTFACEPGRVIRIGCATACNGLGTCTGNPVMRVCDAARPDGNCSYAATLATSDNACESSCPRVKDLFCPASGSVHVYTAPYYVGDPYTCELAFDYQDG